MRRWRLPSAKRLRLPSSASGDDTRSKLETREVERARGWPLWFCMAGRRGCGPRAQPGRKASSRCFNSRQASNVSATRRSQIV